MEFSSIKHVDPGQIADFKADLFVMGLGFESRSTLVARKFEDHTCRKIALEKKNPVKEFFYQDNLNYLKDSGFEIILVESEVPDLDAILQSGMSDSLNVAVDCTNMSPLWYYEFFNWFSNRNVPEGHILMRIAYTMAAYVPKGGGSRVRKIYDFLREDAKAANSRKTALILGLGQEKQVSESIISMLKPDLVYLYYADPPVEKRFVEKVFVNNHKSINEVPIRNLVAYPIRNGQLIYQSLINTILPLRHEYSIVVIPHGPKIFSVVAMLVHLGYPDIRISYPQFKRTRLADRLPWDEPVIIDILFEGEE